MTTATTAGREVTYLEAISQALDEEMARDERVFLMGEDIGPYGGAFRITEGFQQKYGEWRGPGTPPARARVGGGPPRRGPVGGGAPGGGEVGRLPSPPLPPNPPGGGGEPTPLRGAGR